MERPTLAEEETPPRPPWMVAARSPRQSQNIRPRLRRLRPLALQPTAFTVLVNGWWCICTMMGVEHEWLTMNDDFKNGWQKKTWQLSLWGVCGFFFHCQTLLITSHNNLTYIICHALYQLKLYTVSQFACLQSVQVNRLSQVKAVDVHQKKDEGNGPRRDHRGSVVECQTLKINQAAKWKTSLSIRCMLPISFGIHSVFQEIARVFLRVKRGKRSTLKDDLQTAWSTGRLNEIEKVWLIVISNSFLRCLRVVSVVDCSWRSF